VPESTLEQAALEVVPRADGRAHVTRIQHRKMCSRRQVPIANSGARRGCRVQRLKWHTIAVGEPVLGQWPGPRARARSFRFIGVARCCGAGLAGARIVLLLERRLVDMRRGNRGQNQGRGGWRSNGGDRVMFNVLVGVLQDPRFVDGLGRRDACEREEQGTGKPLLDRMHHETKTSVDGTWGAIDNAALARRQATSAV